MSALIRLQSQLAIENHFQYTDEDRFLDEVGIENIYLGVDNGDMEKVTAGITAALESADRVNHYLRDIQAMKFVPKAIYVPLKRSLFETLDDLSLQMTSLATEADYSDGDNYRSLALESLTGALRAIFQAIRKAFAWVWGMLKKIFGFDGERKNRLAENSFHDAQKRLENVLNQMNVFDEAKLNEFVSDTTIPVVMQMRELYKSADHDLNSDDIHGGCDRTLGAALLLRQSMDELYGYQSTLGVFLSTRFLNQDADGIDKMADSFKSDNPIQHHPVLGDLITAQRGLVTLLSQKLATIKYKDLSSAQKKSLDDANIDPSSVFGIPIGDRVCVIVNRKTSDSLPEIDKLLIDNIPLFKMLDGDDKSTSTYTKSVIRPPIPTQLEVIKHNFRKFSELAKDFKTLQDSLFKSSEKFSVFATALEKSGGEDNGRDYKPLISIFSHMSNVYLNASTCLARAEGIRTEEVAKLQKYMEFTAQAYEYAIKAD